MKNTIQTTPFNQGVFLFFALLFQFGLFKVLGNLPFFIDWYIVVFYPFVNCILLSSAASPSWSVGDVLYTLSIVFLVYKLVQSIRRKRVLCFIVPLLFLLNVFFFFFHINWGILYNRTSIYKKLGSPDISTIPVSQWEELTLYFHQKAVDSRPSNFISKKELLQYLQSEETDTKYNLSNHVKTSLYPTLFSYLGVGGYYNPFTGEGQINNNIPVFSLPTTFYHERAHQLGIASETEANFIAFLHAKNSKDDISRYSAYFTAFRQVYFQWYRQAPYEAMNFQEKIDSLILTDLQTVDEYHSKYSGIADNTFSNLNDIYLKSNDQEGVVAYSKVVFLYSIWYTDVVIKGENIDVKRLIRTN